MIENRQVHTNVQAKWETVTCRELTGLDIKTSEGFKEYYKNIHDFACTERIKFAVKKAIELLK